jgi:hypothetical protein
MKSSVKSTAPGGHGLVGSASDKSGRNCSRRQTPTAVVVCDLLLDLPVLDTEQQLVAHYFGDLVASILSEPE